MLNEEANFWSSITEKYDRVVDLQTDQRRGRSSCSDLRGKHASVISSSSAAVPASLPGRSPGKRTPRSHRPCSGHAPAAKHQVDVPNVTFQIEDCQSTSLPTAAFDAALIAFAPQFAGPDRALPESAASSSPAACSSSRTPTPRRRAAWTTCAASFESCARGIWGIELDRRNDSLLRRSMAARSECGDRETPL